MTIHVDLRDIDLASLIEQETPATRFGRPAGNGEKRTRKGTCPWCGGDDRFAVVESDPPHFYCGIHGGAGCGVSGNAVDFMEMWHDIGFMDACARLHVKPIRDGRPFVRRVAPLRVTVGTAPCEDWQLTATYWLARWQHWLWCDVGRESLALLHARGFTDEQIRARGYGCIPATVFDNEPSRWGVTDPTVKAIWLPRGIVIPWYVGGSLWKLNIRRPSADLDADTRRTGHTVSKYVQVKGGSNPIYRADAIQADQPLVLFEGELNADILAQVLEQAGETHIATAATGSTGNGRADTWLVKIAQASPLLISFDPDGGGVKAAKEHWAKAFPQALLWPSVGGDMNDMFLSGMDVLEWIRQGVALAGIPAPLVSDPVAAIETETKEAATPLVQEADTYISKYRPMPALVYTPSQSMRANGCPYLCYPLVTNGHIGPRVPCHELPLANGWCGQHQGSVDVLRGGAAIHFPRLAINESLHVGEGKEQWEALALIISERHLERWIHQVRSLVAQKVARGDICAPVEPLFLGEAFPKEPPNHGLATTCHTQGCTGPVKWYGAYGNAYCARCWDGYQEAKARGVLLR